MLRAVGPSPSPSDSTRSRHHRWALVIPATVAFAYASGHLTWYGGTPLGQVPVLDEQEHLHFAEAIVRGTLPPEPFYRAPGYALLLALLRTLGVPAAGLFPAALVLGVVLHAVNAALAAQIARRLFASSAAALAAGLLFALHPVFVHYSTQALDAVPALTCFLLGLALLTPALTRPADAPAPLWLWAAASVSWAVAVIFRPNYLLPWGLLPVLAVWILRPGRRLRAAAAAAAGAGAIVFALVAAWQGRLSGEASFLPWQGPYNLWAANQPGTHGRYYVQRVSLPPALAAQNPARAESIFLYQQEKGSAPPDLRTLNAHWRTRFLDHVRQHPLAWLGLLARKTYALLNDWEQYNNKTFAFHQARSPWLRWNPLGWGLLFVLSLAGAAHLAHTAPASRAPLAVITAACALSVVLFFVSARFRLPLAALAAILAGGALAAPLCWRAWPRPRQLAFAAILPLAAAVTFSNFDGVRDRATFVQDHALLARAADTLGDDAQAWREATAALALQPGHPDALRLAIAAYFNQLLAGAPAPGAEFQWRRICTRFLDTPGAGAPDLRAVAALALWRSRQTEAALAVWRRLGPAPSAVAARLLVQDLTPAQADPAAWPRAAWDEPLVRLAALRAGLPPPPGMTLGEAAQAAALFHRLFAEPASASAPP